MLKNGNSSQQGPPCPRCGCLDTGKFGAALCKNCEDPHPDNWLCHGCRGIFYSKANPRTDLENKMDSSGRTDVPVKENKGQPKGEE